MGGSGMDEQEEGNCRFEAVLAKQAQFDLVCLICANDFGEGEVRGN